jgi:pyridoxamine 5'-phosphate oxidase
MAPDPIARFQRWFAQARRAGVPLTEAVALATSTRRGIPSVRFVLMKGADARGFTFFTNGQSRKGRELHENPRAEMAFYWNAIGKQVRVGGRVERVSAAEADAYWATRPRASQLAALASEQSAALPRRASLTARWRRLRLRHRGGSVPRPPHWGGFRIVPETIEFWTHREHRLHERELFTRARRGWKRRLLQP